MKETLTRTTMAETLTHEDIRDLLIGFAAAIELDQIRVDALPPERFHRWYDDSMWRNWRRYHVDYIKSVASDREHDAVGPAPRTGLTGDHPRPGSRRGGGVNLCSEAASGCCPAEEHETATLFFGWLIKGVSDRPACKLLNGDARTLMKQWLAADDPLWIAKDPECGYG